jgi:hypothetical protein
VRVRSGDGPLADDGNGGGEGGGAAIVGLAEELAQAHLADDPFIASYLGIGDYDDAVPDLSPSARQAWRDRLVDVLVRCQGLEAEAEDLDSRVLLAAVQDHAIRGLAWADARVQEFSVTALPANGMFGLAMMLLVATRTSITDPAGAAAFLTRCRRFPTYVEQYGARLQTATADGLLPVAPLVQGVIDQLGDHLAHPDRDPLLAHQPPRAGMGRRPGGRSWSGSCGTMSVRRWAAIWTCWSSCCPGRGRRSEPGWCMCPAGWWPMGAAFATPPPWPWMPRSCIGSA